MWNSASGALNVRNSTLDGNTASGNGSDQGGGGIYNDGGTVGLDSITLTRNSAQSLGGGVLSVGGTVRSLNSIIAQNKSGDAPSADIAGAFNSQGFNFIGANNADSGAASNSDVRGTPSNPRDPQLGTLSDNGGPTQTRLPQPGSPVVDAGGTTLNADQRGATRPAGARADIGAVEIATSPQKLGQRAGRGGGNCEQRRFGRQFVRIDARKETARDESRGPFFDWLWRFFTAPRPAQRGIETNIRAQTLRNFRLLSSFFPLRLLR